MQHRIGLAFFLSLFLGAALGLRRTSELRNFWLICLIAIPLAVFTTNAALHYFFATRQLIYILPALALLFTLGTEPRPSGSGQAGKLLLLTFLAASLYEDVQWFRKPREDWQAAANALQREVTNGACVSFLADTTPVYLYFHPQLAAHLCAGPQDRVVIATSPYIPSSNYAPPGLTLKAEQSFNGPRIEVFAK